MGSGAGGGEGGGGQAAGVGFRRERWRSGPPHAPHTLHHVSLPLHRHLSQCWLHPTSPHVHTRTQACTHLHACAVCRLGCSRHCFWAVELPLLVGWRPCGSGATQVRARGWALLGGWSPLNAWQTTLDSWVEVGQAWRCMFHHGCASRTRYSSGV